MNRRVDRRGGEVDARDQRGARPGGDEAVGEVAAEGERVGGAHVVLRAGAGDQGEEDETE